MIPLLAALLLVAPTQTPTLTRAPARPAAAALGTEPFAEAEPDVVLRGRTLTIVVRGRDLESLKTLQLSPPGGVEIRSITPLPSRADQSAAVSVELAVAASAEPGERVLLLTVPPQISTSSATRPGDDSTARAMEAMVRTLVKDRTPPLETGSLYINSHELAVTAVTVGIGESREVRITVTDAVGDLRTPATGSAGIVVVSGFSELLASEARCASDVIDGVLDEAEVKETGAGTVILVARLMHLPPVSGTCTLRVRVYDQAHNTSPWFTTKLTAR